MQEVTTFISHHFLLSLAMMAVLLLILMLETIRAKRNTFNITPAQLTQLINKKNAVVIDTRTHEAFRSGHIIGAQIFTAQDIQNLKKLEKLKNRPLVIVSTSVPESQKLAVLLIKQGYNAYSLLGGIKAWSDAEMPLVKE